MSSGKIENFVGLGSRVLQDIDCLAKLHFSVGIRSKLWNCNSLAVYHRVQNISGYAWKLILKKCIIEYNYFKFVVSINSQSTNVSGMAL